ncbi:MAG: hypothetical protein UX49_C0003G0003 [Candidatus Wolfebacteria bacterium GW2011_GWC2_46_275]|uniref:HD domain-containing protein n=2 Tax=Candidatus Wolfeibacteriota TaxID=1752735 RepID=A0A0G1U7Y9_9BACT|nr:MAG: hypothetical protein UX70_C0001G0381 [Candidatus Wolfebacteria bacterium GW2011_GWB1_47_1]KKU37041.1 MAG: hypothetical protein UX49_C0003G0003 [Candidatus Wolfebacteria bacterium GW2011_GWC2_46_275]KKU42588.1 MAG: hypothetical protein UX58_C0001G0020 [Candidatus Wolfebacteria bacterium GW2011_GWB2_46_69]KKU54677.1 MAG: hypothetical protein UX76_C0001G0136 [Candidatus Wolfebacteria bacterium GW2011_GWC1_47_103]KKU58741.1 MAG: hypothetical protein UX83_C0012G0002 [Candidatus Wolfebacteria
MDKFQVAKNKIVEVVSHSEKYEDPGHSLNTLHWVLKLNPDADEIVQLAALAHDIERGIENRLTVDMFETYKAYKGAHAIKAAELASGIISDAGYSDQDAMRLFAIIKDAETGSDDPDVNLIMDADSISFFDYIIEYYFKAKDAERTKKKMWFAYDRASNRSKKIIDGILESKPFFQKLFKERN